MNETVPVPSGPTKPVAALRRGLVVFFDRGHVRSSALAQGLTSFTPAIRRYPFLAYIAFVLTLASIYYLLLAVPQYASQAQFAVRGKQAVAAVPLLAAFTGAVQTGTADSSALTDYIQSEEMLSVLDKQFDLRGLYSGFRLDFLWHMPRRARQEDFLAFYRDMTDVSLDSDSNIVTVTVRSFTPQSAQAIARAVLAQSTVFVNDLSAQMQNESLRSSQADLNSALDANRRATAALTDFRSRTGNLDPGALGTASGAGMMNLQEQIYALRAQLASTMTYSTANSPAVKQTQAQIAYLEKQIDQVRNGMASTGPSDTLAKQISQYQTLLADQTYAQQRVAVTQAALDQARSVAAQKELFVVPVVRPNLPDRSTVPSRFTDIFIVLLVACILYGIARLAIASVRDHIGN